MNTTLKPSIVQLPPEPHAAIVDRYGLHGGHIGTGEDESPWVPFGDCAAIRHLSFDVRTGSVCNILWVKGGGRIGTHRHRAAVSAVTLEGTWGYYEYDWVAKPGSFVFETPGTAHTLYSDDPDMRLPLRTGKRSPKWLLLPCSKAVHHCRTSQPFSNAIPCRYRLRLWPWRSFLLGCLASS